LKYLLTERGGNAGEPASEELASQTSGRKGKGPTGANSEGLIIMGKRRHSPRAGEGINRSVPGEPRGISTPEGNPGKKDRGKRVLENSGEGKKKTTSHTKCLDVEFIVLLPGKNSVKTRKKVDQV